jgi:hypothetical protein
MQVNGRHNIDELLERMEAVRARLDHDARAAKQSVQEMTDWRRVVRKNPLISVTVAAVAGFLLVPKKKTQPSFTSEELKQLAKDHSVIVAKESSASPGLISTVTAIASAALGRAATNYVAKKIGESSFLNEREAT